MPADRRTFDTLLSQLHDGSLHPLILADWLEENNAGLDLWCLAWRDCPEPAEEFQARWAAWLKEREPKEMVESWGKFRWCLVSWHNIGKYEDGATAYWYINPPPLGSFRPQPYLTPGRAALGRKRRVLGLFSEVEVVIDGQAIRAPDLIPLDGEYGPSPLRNAYAAFNDLRQINEAQQEGLRRRAPEPMRGVFGSSPLLDTDPLL